MVILIITFVLSIIIFFIISITFLIFLFKTVFFDKKSCEKVNEFNSVNNAKHKNIVKPNTLIQDISSTIDTSDTNRNKKTRIRNQISENLLKEQNIKEETYELKEAFATIENHQHQYEPMSAFQHRIHHQQNYPFYSNTNSFPDRSRYTYYTIKE